MVGMDVHKWTHTAVAVTAVGAKLGQLTIKGLRTAATLVSGGDQLGLGPNRANGLPIPKAANRYTHGPEDPLEIPV